VRSFWPDGREKLLPQNPSIRAADFLFEGGGQGCTFVVRAELFRKVSEFCTEKLELCEQFHYHDWLMYLLARAWGLSWYFDQQDWMRYRQHLGNEIGSRGSMAAVRRRIALIKNGWYRTQVNQAVAICREVGAVEMADEFSKLQAIKPELVRRLRTANFVVRNGRRKFSDRAVQGISALAGWL
jgi:rhamnosyltransferase